MGRQCRGRDGNECKKRPYFGLRSDKKAIYCARCRPSTAYVSLQKKKAPGSHAQACCCNKKETGCVELRHQHDAKGQVDVPKGEANEKRAMAILSAPGLCPCPNKVCAAAAAQLILWCVSV